MDPQQNSLSSRWHSSMTNSSITHHSDKSRSPAPRNASTWDSFQGSSSHHPTISGITRRISSVTTYVNSLAPENSDTCNIVVPRKGSAWDATLMSGSARASASGIARRRASVVERHQPSDMFSRAPTTNEGPSDKKAHAKTTVLHRSFEWDPFSGPPPRIDGSTWSWMSDIVITCDIYSAPHSSSSVTSVITQVLYAGNIEYMFKIHDGKSLAIADVEAIMHVYGVENTSAQDIVRKVDPKRLGRFNLNPKNKQFLLASTTNFSKIKEPLNILRHASKCFEDNMLSPPHFTAYIFQVLDDKYLEGIMNCKFVPTYSKFNILGMHGLLGVLERSTNRLLTTKDVETFTRVWKILSPNEIKGFIAVINNDYRGAINCTELYFLLYHRNWQGKQRVQKFYNSGQQDPSMLFYLIDIDKDGLLSSDDIRSFVGVFGQYPSNKAINKLIWQLDMDSDGRVNSDEFCLAMKHILDGITWEFWIVAIILLITWEF